jgi:hypothetical protein
MLDSGWLTGVDPRSLRDVLGPGRGAPRCAATFARSGICTDRHQLWRPGLDSLTAQPVDQSARSASRLPVVRVMTKQDAVGVEGVELPE